MNARSHWLLSVALLGLAPAQAVEPGFHGAPASAQALRNPVTGRQAPAAGRSVYQAHCAACHGADAQGAGNIPALTAPSVKQASDGELFWFITHGSPANGMPAWEQLPQRQRWQLVAFLRAFMNGTAPASTASTASATAVSRAIDAPAPTPPFTDFRYEAPGRARRITPADLPPPFASPSAGNGPRIVPRPEGMQPQAPPGFRVGLYASGVDHPRHLRTAPNGDLFVALSRAGRIQVFRGAAKDGSATVSSVFLEGLQQPSGIAFYPPGPQPQWIYIAQTDAVLRVPYRNGDLEARAAPERLTELAHGVGNRPHESGHWTRDIGFSPDGRTLYVAVGSHSNVDDPDTSPAERERARILAFNPDGSGKRVFAGGIRNPSGLAVQPGTADLWCSVNERDGLGDDLVPDYITRVQEHGFYGWPWWYTGAHQDPRHPGAHPELKSQVIVPDVLLQPHSASLQLTFYDGRQFPPQYRGDIFAAEHGSWNRSVRAGYEVIRVPLHQTGHASGAYEDFLTGFVLDNGDVWGRPVGVAVAQDGALLVTDDEGGTIWRVSYTGAAGVPAPTRR